MRPRWHPSGGTRPPRLSPAGGNGKGGVQTSVPPQAVRVGVVRMPGTPLVYCVLALLPRFSPLRSPNLYVDSLVPLSRNLTGTTHSFCRASIRTLHGPHWARCKLGSDLKPRSITTVTDLGCWVLPSCGRSFEDQSYQTQSPEQGGGFLCLPKLLEVCWPSRHQLMLAMLAILPHLVSRRRLL